MSSGIRTFAEVVGVGLLREVLAACVAQCRRIELPAFERASSERMRDALLPAVEDVLRRTLAMLDAAVVLYGDAHGALIPEVDALDEDLRRGVTSIACIGVSELGARIEELAALRDADADELRDACRGARRHTLRTLATLDAAIADAHGTLPRAGFGDVLSESIATRRHYARLRRAICAGGAPHDTAALRRRLERAQLEMLMLTSCDVYAVVRLSDRRRLHTLMARVEAALSDDGGAGALAGTYARLYQDLVGFAGMIAEVSRREELVLNDTRVLCEAIEVLASDEAMDPWLRARLESMEGLDDEADALILARDFSVEAWRWCVARLHARIARPASGRVLARDAMGAAS